MSKTQLTMQAGAGGGVGNLNDLLLFYTLERKLFNRLVGQFGKNPQNVKAAIAFWLLLEKIGFRDFTRIVQSQDDTTIHSIFDETLKCLSLVQPGVYDEPNRLEVDTSTPVFESILEEPINLRFLYYHSEFMFGKFVHIMETVCDRIFGEMRAIEVDTCCENLNTNQEFGEEIVYSREERRPSSGLDHNAREFLPQQINQDCRTLFLTFSKGYPLSPQEIINFFASEWGDVVEDVVVEETRGGYQPVYGRIIFKEAEASIIPRVLNGQSKAKFVVGRKHLWARLYIPRRR